MRRTSPPSEGLGEARACRSVSWRGGKGGGWTFISLGFSFYYNVPAPVACHGGVRRPWHERAAAAVRVVWRLQDERTAAAVRYRFRGKRGDFERKRAGSEDGFMSVFVCRNFILKVLKF